MPPAADKQHERLERIISDLIDALQIESHLDEPARTATRVAEMLQAVFAGKDADLADILSRRIPVTPAQSGQLVTLASIRFHSMCQHHFLPFSGYVTIAYVPEQEIIGLGRIVQLVHALAQRPQLQEYLAAQIADQLEQAMQPRGLAVHIVAYHLCQAMHGEHEQSMNVHSHIYRGVFAHDAGLQQAFLRTTPQQAT